MQIPFTKMHGIGNDFVMIDAYSPQNRSLAELAQKHSVFLCDRHFGIGGDGVIVILPSPNTDSEFEMVMYNPDGSLSEMCGNGIRCFAKYVVDHGYTTSTNQRILTGRGVLVTDTSAGNNMVRVDMGAPILPRQDIPASLPGDPNTTIVSETLVVDGKPYSITCVSMGNPHCVVFVDDDPDSINLNDLGPKFENHSAFPKRINTEFIQVLSRREYKMRVWERGAAETLACGTGACASAVAGILNGYFENQVTGHLAGGDLILEWDGMGSVMMTGSAKTVFSGTVNLS